MQVKATELAQLLPHGAQVEIAKKLGISRQAVGLALSKAKPGHPAVVEALRIARETGALGAAQDMATLNAA